MHMIYSILLVISIADTNTLAFFIDEWTENVKQFFQQTQQTINEKSHNFVNELHKKIENAQDFVERSKDVLDIVASNLKTSGEKLKATVMETAETTLRGAGDEVEGFFSEVPNRVNDGFDELLAKLAEACSWIFKNIIAPIIFIITVLGLTYIFVVSGCCGCCCSTLLSQFGISLSNAFKRLKNDKSLDKGERLIILRDLESSIPLQPNETLSNQQSMKNIRILRI